MNSPPATATRFVFRSRLDDATTRDVPFQNPITLHVTAAEDIPAFISPKASKSVPLDLKRFKFSPGSIKPCGDLDLNDKCTLISEQLPKVHAYDQTEFTKYSLDPCDPVYITVGDGGTRKEMSISHADDPGNCPEPYSIADEEIGGFFAFDFTSGPAAGMFCWEKQPEYSAYRESSYGHGILEVKKETHALWSWHRNQEYYEIARDIINIV